jgi:hypothetical protein
MVQDLTPWRTAGQSCAVENAFIFGLAYISLPDDEKALA